VVPGEAPGGAAADAEAGGQLTEISVVLPARYAEETIVRTLEAVLEQCRELEAEVIVVVSAEDPTRGILAGMKGVRVIEMPGRRSVPELRGEGIRAARGKLVAITEDHCLFSPVWLATMREIHGQREVAAVGGPVENGRAGSPLDWAIYFSRYLGSMPPVGLGSVGGLPGNNACYRREVLERFASLYERGFWEHEFNRELVASGYVLWQDPRLVVTHHKPYRFLPYLALRYRHARCFGGREGGAGGADYPAQEAAAAGVPAEFPGAAAMLSGLVLGRAGGAPGGARRVLLGNGLEKKLLAISC
jgi:glycosyltransferase involved in cell wall biosynthesis